ncbi:cell wall hydrolase [Oceanicaulis sp.]|uniref:cell wall hydrolase n=1 Tax=Oceanicaulis sp. TaxID=1924941 RepID=UPI003D26E514
MAPALEYDSLTLSTLLLRAKSALAGIGMIAAFVVIAAGVSLAPERAQQQDQAGELRELALEFLDFEQSRAPQLDDVPFSFASFEIGTDDEQGAVLVQRAIERVSAFDLNDLDAARNAARERRCLAEAIYYEARSETLAGQMAVAEVVINRSRHRAYPNTICGVVYQGAERRTGCQFTFTCDGSMGSAPYGRGWDRAQNVADHALMGFARPVTNRATHYHTTAVDPHWNDSLVRTRRIGSHIFYRFPNRSERRLLAEREA